VFCSVSAGGKEKGEKEGSVRHRTPRFLLDVERGEGRKVEISRGNLVSFFREKKGGGEINFCNSPHRLGEGRNKLYDHFEGRKGGGGGTPKFRWIC